MIIETTCNRFFQVRPTNDADLDHVWYGFRVKRTATGGFIPTAKVPRTELVSKAHCLRIIEQDR